MRLVQRVLVLGALTSLVLAGTVLDSPAEATSKKLTVGKIANARVPSLCGHPAGRLVSGQLPTAIQPGSVTLRRDKVTFGKLRNKQRRSAAAVLSCSRGGPAMPENVVVYSPKRRIIGVFQLGAITKGGRDSVRRLWIKKRVLHVQVINIAAADDALCCGTRSAHLRFKYSKTKQRVTLRSKRVYSERRAAKAIVKAVNSGRTGKLARYASRAEAATYRSWRRQGYRLELRSCHGSLSSTYAYLLEDYGSGTARMCVLHRWKPGTWAVVEGLFFSPKSWKAWRSTASMTIGSTH